jgi:HSP20 family protein
MTLVKFRNGNRFANLPEIEGSLSLPSFFSDALDRLWSDDNVSWMPSVNIREGAEDFRIDLAVPGMSKEDFKVEVENNILSVSGERKEEKKEENEKVTRSEFHYGSFKRSFNLPESANSENISANYKDGILSLSIAKHESAKPKAKKLISVA